MSGGKEDWAARARAVIGAESNNFMELLKISGLDPKMDLRFADWSGVDFSLCDLRGFDFTAARLKGCRFDGALIKGARFDQAEIDGANPRAAMDWTAHRRGWVKARQPVRSEHLPAGAVFQDAPFAPEMVVVPPGRFWMGSRDGEGEDYERPRHEVMIPCAIAVGRYPVTFEEWDIAQASPEWIRTKGTKLRQPDDQGWGRGRRPVIDVSWEHARAYAKWLSRKVGQPYRLLSEGEWEYACRAGSEAAYCFGDNEAELGDYAWYNGNSKSRTHPVGEKMPNKFGLHDMHGNVWEWCEDVWHESYEDKPGEITMPPGLFHAPFGVGVFAEALGGEANGGARTTGGGGGRVLRGGSWNSVPTLLRSANRDGLIAGFRSGSCGFRLARTLLY